MKKIVIHTGNISIGGQEKMLIEFLKVLSPEKYNIELFIEENKGEENYYENSIPDHVKYSFLTDEAFMEKIKKLRRSRNPLKKIRYSFMLKKKKIIGIKKINEKLKECDVLIDYDMGLLRHLDKLNKKGILVGWSHAGEGVVLKNKKKNENIGIYDYIVAINDVMKKGYEKNYTPKVVKIENFIDEKEILRKGEEEILEKDLGEYILTVGSLTENKNHKELILAFKRYIEDFDGKENLVIVGEGKERKNLEELIEKGELKDRVFLLGNKENPYSYMKRAKFYIQGSKAESFSLVLAEAMVFGKAVISKLNIGSNDVLDTGRYGILLENIPSELPEVLNELVVNSEKRRRYENLSLERVKEFETKKAKEKIEEFIDSL